jgi:hypothetical protein
VTLGKYATLVLAAVATLLAASWKVLPEQARAAVVAGGLLAAANTVLAYFLVLWTSGRSTNAFLAAVLGGMVGRMGMMLAAVVAGVLLLDLPKVPFAISLLAFFVLFLVLELTLLHRHTSAPTGAR